MSFSLIARKTVVCWCLAIAVPTLVNAQGSYTTNGGEYSITGALPGNQMLPRVSINAGGGYLVWEDNWTDGDGLGISGLALDSTLSKVFAPFRVNQHGGGDQEKPQVALLPNGGAVFVWQGGSFGFQHVYARFLSSSNTWITGDVLVSASANTYQLDPAVAALNNGNVAIVWSSRGQQGASSMQDVFAQIFSPSGQKLYSSDIPINQFTPYNQRTPAIAALTNGGFVVAWISEQERYAAKVVMTVSTNINGGGQPVTYSTNWTTGAAAPVGQLPQPSVDVFARLYDANGAPTVNEFLVNTSSNICANPAVAAGADGGFIVAWSAKDTTVPDNSWDIFARPFSISAGFPIGIGDIRVNTQLYGDQFAPQVAAQGAHYLVVWTSLGQDGSYEGVYGQFVNGDGSRSGGEFRVNTSTLGAQKQPAVAADNCGRFLAVWTTPTFGPSKFDLDAQIYASADFVPPVYADNYGAPTFVPDSPTNYPPGDGPGAPEGGNPVLDFPVAFSSVGAGNPANYALAQGAFAGLFYDTNGVNASSAGYLSLKLTSKGTFSGKILLAGGGYSVSGQLDDLGHATKVIQPRGTTALTVTLQLDTSSNDTIVGQVRPMDGSWSAQLLALKAASTQVQRKYTLMIPAGAGAAGPAGSGIGTLAVDAKSNIRWNGLLADGTRVNQAGVLSKQGIWPVYSSLYGGKGALLSWVRFASRTGDDLNGQWVWIRPSGAAASYPSGFTNEVWAVGSAYNAVTGTRSLGLSAGTLTLSGGAMAQPVTYSLHFGSNNKMVLPSGLKLVVVNSSGMFSGTATTSGGSFPFQGVLLQKGSLGAGFFLNANLSGQVYWSQAP